MKANESPCEDEICNSRQQQHDPVHSDRATNRNDSPPSRRSRTEPATARIEDAGWPTELRRSHAELRAASGDGCSSRCRYTRNSERRSAKPESQALRPRGSSHSVFLCNEFPGSVATCAKKPE